MNEFDLIDHCFLPLGGKHSEVLRGIGDDAACLRLPAGQDLLVATDTLVSGVHFLPEWSAADIGWRALMCNISDIAAMGGVPRWLSLALTAETTEPHWYQEFARGLQEAMALYDLALIGGDTTRGPLTISISLQGLVPQGQAVYRHGAKAGDLIVVTGPLGAAALAVAQIEGRVSLAQDVADQAMAKLKRPQARMDFSLAVREFATAAIDISDGLSADLGHICRQSGLGVCLQVDKLPLHPLLNRLPIEQAIDIALTGGDDYEICMTVNPARLGHFQAWLRQQGLTAALIGCMEAEPGMRLLDGQGRRVPIAPRGYDHFKGEPNAGHKSE